MEEQFRYKHGKEYIVVLATNTGPVEEEEEECVRKPPEVLGISMSCIERVCRGAEPVVP